MPFHGRSCPSIMIICIQPHTVKSVYIYKYIEAVLLNHNHSDNQIRLHSCVKKVKQ